MHHIAAGDASFDMLMAYFSVLLCKIRSSRPKAFLLNLARLRDKFVNYRVSLLDSYRKARSLSPANDFAPERSVLRKLLERDKIPLFFELNYHT